MDKQLLEFMTQTTKSLGRIEAYQETTNKDMAELKVQCDKIPLIEQGLNNHLSSHNRLKNGFMYPVSATLVAGIILSVLHWIFKVF